MFRRNIEMPIETQKAVFEFQYSYNYIGQFLNFNFSGYGYILFFTNMYK